MAAGMLYAAPIHHAIAGGDVEEMRRLLAEAEQHIAEWGNVPVAVELLKVELARAEQRGS